MIKGTITAYTAPSIGNIDIEAAENLEAFIGKNAAICYMKNDYESINKEDIKKSIDRFAKVIGSGHHSIADHVYITVVFENIPKIIAMILNSLQAYNTSEKSGRYTETTSDASDKELELYNKWKDKCIKALKDQISDKSKMEKIAMENARYFLSVFNHSVTMSYTASYRQWNYIYNWCKDCSHELFDDSDENLFLIKTNNINKDKIKFRSLICKELDDVAKFIENSGIRNTLINDNKHRYFDFIPYQAKSSNNIKVGELYPVEDYFGMVYNTSYNISFAGLAQAQRHRTIKYKMLFDGTPSEFYIPRFIAEDIELKKEWIEDMKSISNLFPQATLVTVNEYGTLDSFKLKCSERLCYRAQLEISDNTITTLNKYYKNFAPKEYNKIELFSDIIKLDDSNKITPRTKCDIIGGCKEPCVNQSKYSRRKY